MKTLYRIGQLSLRFSLFLAAFSLLQLNVACTGRSQTASTFGDNSTLSIPTVNTGNPFGDNFQLDDPFGTGTQLTADDFALTTTDDPDLTTPFFDPANPNPTLQSNCTQADLFSSGGFFTDPSSTNLSGCLNSSQLSQASNYGGSMNTYFVQLMLSMVTQGTQWSLTCINVARQYEPIVNQNAQVGFILAAAAITSCYRNIYQQIAGSPYFAEPQADRMQSFEPDWIVLIRDILGQQG